MRFVFALLALSATAAAAQDAVPIRPDLSKTPGAVNPALDQPTVCSVSFSTKPFRKASKSDRRCVLDRYGGKPSYAFTYDHLVPLELGGADSCDNLWPEPRAEAVRKDKLEDALRDRVCDCKDLTLAEAQDLIRRNWLAGFARYVTPKASPRCAVNAATH